MSWCWLLSSCLRSSSILLHSASWSWGWSLQIISPLCPLSPRRLPVTLHQKKLLEGDWKARDSFLLLHFLLASHCSGTHPRSSISQQQQCLLRAAFGSSPQFFLTQAGPVWCSLLIPHLRGVGLSPMGASANPETPAPPSWMPFSKGCISVLHGLFPSLQVE